MGLGWHPIYEMENKMFETTNQSSFVSFFRWKPIGWTHRQCGCAVPGLPHDLWGFLTAFSIPHWEMLWLVQRSKPKFRPKTIPFCSMYPANWGLMVWMMIFQRLKSHWRHSFHAKFRECMSSNACFMSHVVRQYFIFIWLFMSYSLWFLSDLLSVSSGFLRFILRIVWYLQHVRSTCRGLSKGRPVAILLYLLMLGHQ